jgi:hypothetical protein
MTFLNMTNHAETRFSQRSLSPNDLSLLLRIGSETSEGFMVLNRDFQSFERDLKRLAQRVRRLVGKRIIVNSGKVVTGYQCCKKTEKAMLRNSKEKGLV